MCGEIGTLPEFKWLDYGDEEDQVNVIMKNIGMNDGKPEGMSFNISGNGMLAPRFDSSP